MTDDRFEELMMKHLRQAEEDGVRPPVIALLHPKSSPAQAIHAERHGRPLRRGEGDYTEKVGLMETWTVEQAVRLLRRHAGLGGNAVANRLEGPPLELGHWMLMLLDERLCIGSFPRGGRPVSSSAYYDRLPFSVCPACARKARPVALTVEVRGGDEVAVRGRTVAEAGMAAGLVGVVAGRWLPSLPAQGEGKVVNLPLRDDDLAAILRDHYADAPGAVAQAVRSLRLAQVKRRRWLTRTLQGRPELAALAASVSAELETL